MRLHGNLVLWSRDIDARFWGALACYGKDKRCACYCSLSIRHSHCATHIGGALNTLVAFQREVPAVDFKAQGILKFEEATKQATTITRSHKGHLRAYHFGGERNTHALEFALKLQIAQSVNHLDLAAVDADSIIDGIVTITAGKTLNKGLIKRLAPRHQPTLRTSTLQLRRPKHPPNKSK